MNATRPTTNAARRSFCFAAFFAALVAAAATPAVPAPPHYPDATHVFNGCHLSALAYLDRFTTDFPAEQGRPIVVQMRNGDGAVRSHTMALVTWNGEWWIRDEYFGVFPLECSPATETKEARLVARAERLYARHAEAAVRAGTARPPEPPARFSAEDRRRNVNAAADKLPVAHMIYWISEGTHEIPVVFFRPARGVIGVYDPVHGSAIIDCTVRDDAKLAGLIAAKLGYHVEGVRAEPAGFYGALIASTGLFTPSFIR